VHIYAHTGKIIIDTIFSVHAEHRTVNGPILSLPFDSVYIETRYCQPLRHYIDLFNRNCNDMIIDSVILSPQYPELVIDTTQSHNLFLAKNSFGRGIPVFFQTDSNITRKTSMRIVAHSLDRKIDTTIILVAKHSTAPEPYLGILQNTKAGDTVLVPVYVKVTQDSFTITHYVFHLSYDGDILFPANPAYQLTGTLSAFSNVTIGKSEPNGILCTIDCATPITQSFDLSQPLVYLRFGVILSKKMSCSVILDTFSLSRTAPLPLCIITATEFSVDPQCGDSAISSFMLDGKMPAFLGVYPNPSLSSVVDMNLYLPFETDLSLDILDENGKYIRSGISYGHYQKGNQSLNINTSSLGSGVYYLRLHLGNGSLLTGSVVITK
jgi:hypothetical protein